MIFTEVRKMSLGQKLFDLRKRKNLSQEEVADQLHVTRQTVSKWETDQSTPDLDKLGPLCELYEISADELLTGKKEDSSENSVYSFENETDFYYKKKKAIGISVGILFYFIAVCFIMIAIPIFMMNPIVASAIFLLICGVATFIIVYSCLVYRRRKDCEREEKSRLQKQISVVLSSVTLVIYLVVSLFTMQWHITWLIWIVYALVEEIVKLIFLLRGVKHEK